MNEENIFPADMDEIIIEDEEIQESFDYVEGIAFDTDFIRDGKNNVKGASGVDSWKQWCINCLATERYASALYSSDFGISAAEILRAPTREEIESLFQSEIKEALEADPYGRTDYVGAIEFEWGTDFANVYVEVVGADGAAIDFEVKMEGR